MIALLLAGCGAPDAPTTGVRIVAIGPAVAEVVHALAPEALVGVDDASIGLAGLADLPKVGFSRTVAAEGVLSLGPTLVIADDRAGPPVVFEQLAAAGVDVRRLPHERSVAGVKALVRGVADAVGGDPTTLLERFDASCAPLEAPVPPARALFVYAGSEGALSVSGTGTAAHAMLGLAGLENAMPAWDGYRPLTPEAAVTTDPDLIVLTTRGLQQLGGVEGVRALPSLGMTTAAREGRVVAVDDIQLLAFGLGTCAGATALRAGL